MNTELITYMGKRFTSTGALKAFYDSPKGQYAWRNPIVYAAKVGAIVEVTLNDRGGFYAQGEHGPKIVGYMDDQIKRGEWEAASIAAATLHAQRRQEKKINRENPTPVEVSIKLIQAHILDLSRQEMKAFIAHLLGELL